MTGFRISSPGAFVNSGKMSRLKDPMLTQGSMLLIDPTNEADPWVDEVPAAKSVVPNLAAAELAELLPHGSDTNFIFDINAAFSGAAGLAERTSKGGMHAIGSQSGATIARTAPVIQFPRSLITYVLTNWDHDYYISAWATVTRKSLAGYNNGNIISLNCGGQQTNSYLYVISVRQDDVMPYVNRPQGLAKRVPAVSGAPSIVTVLCDRWYTNIAGVDQNPPPLPGDGTQTPYTSLYAGGQIVFGGSPILGKGIGSAGQVNDSVNVNVTSLDPSKDKAGSSVFYRAYMEDLTVSGRTYVEVDAMDYSLFTAEVVTAGGRYYGDTYTDPATIP